MPPLKPNATVPVPEPTEPSSTDPPLAVFDGGEHILPHDVSSPDVVQVSVVCFADQRVDGLDILVSRQSQHVVDERVRNTRHTQGGCEQDRSFDFAKFIHLGGASQLAEGVTEEDRAGHLFAENISGMWQDGVTPVRTSSRRMIVVCPTSTPATSVIASSRPLGRIPSFSPKSGYQIPWLAHL